MLTVEMMWYIVAIAGFAGVIVGYLGATAFEDLMEWVSLTAIRHSDEYKERVKVETFFHIPNWDDETFEEYNDRLTWLAENTSLITERGIEYFPTGN